MKKTDKRMLQADGSAIEDLRHRKAWSQEELSTRASCSQSTIKRALGGKNLRMQHLRQIASALGVGLSRITRDFAPIGSEYRPGLTKARLPYGPPSRNWVSRLNRYIGSGVEVCKVVATEPLIIEVGALTSSADISSRVATIRDELRNSNRPNDSVAVLKAPPILTDDSVTLHVLTTDYATVQALREIGDKRTLVSGTALLVCNETQELVLQQRSSVSRDYAGALHTFGGAYSPLLDHQSLVDTARRETLEECSVAFTPRNVPAMIVIHEKAIDFFQLALLGIAISEEDIAAIKSIGEGVAIRQDFYGLVSKLSNARLWVPSGRAQVLAWLALGAPSSDDAQIRFEERSGQQLFDLLVPRVP